jgi:hypothetical protein
MSNILIVPDVHEKIEILKRLLEDYPDTDTVFLGDWLDDFDSDVISAECTVEWLRNNVENPRYRFLWGNHDLSNVYGLNNRELMCSGFMLWKQPIVKELTYENCWRHFGLITLADKYLCSHAGLHKMMMPWNYRGSTKNRHEALEAEATRVLNALRAGTVDPWLQAGRSRGGVQEVGGITWLDWSEFEPIDGLNQIVGHTRRDGEVRRKKTSKSDNWCIDTELFSALLIENGVPKIIPVPYD